MVQCMFGGNRHIEVVDGLIVDLETLLGLFWVILALIVFGGDNQIAHAMPFSSLWAGFVPLRLLFTGSR